MNNALSCREQKLAGCKVLHKAAIRTGQKQRTTALSFYSKPGADSHLAGEATEGEEAGIRWGLDDACLHRHFLDLFTQASCFN